MIFQEEVRFCDEESPYVFDNRVVDVRYVLTGDTGELLVPSQAAILFPVFTYATKKYPPNKSPKLIVEIIKFSMFSFAQRFKTAISSPC